MATAADWSLVDLGVVTVPTVGNPANWLVTLHGGPPPVGRYGGAYTSTKTRGASEVIGINEVYVVPEESSTLIRDAIAAPLAADDLGGTITASQIVDFHGRSDLLGNSWSSPSVIFAGPRLFVRNWGFDLQPGGYLIGGSHAGVTTDSSWAELTGLAPVVDLRVEVDFLYGGTTAATVSSFSIASVNARPGIEIDHGDVTVDYSATGDGASGALFLTVGPSPRRWPSPTRAFSEPTA